MQFPLMIRKIKNRFYDSYTATRRASRSEIATTMQFFANRILSSMILYLSTFRLVNKKRRFL